MTPVDADACEPRPPFDAAERDPLHRLISRRRDVRHFVPGRRVDEPARQRLLDAAQRAPSVGLVQPWRFVRIAAASLRDAIARPFDVERQANAAALGDRGDEFLRLRSEGVRDCAELWVAALAPDDGSVSGRRTMPLDMAPCSLAGAIENPWLAVTAENKGMGWVSMSTPPS